MTHCFPWHLCCDVSSKHRFSCRRLILMLAVVFTCNITDQLCNSWFETCSYQRNEPLLLKADILKLLNYHHCSNVSCLFFPVCCNQYDAVTVVVPVFPCLFVLCVQFRVFSLSIPETTHPLLEENPLSVLTSPLLRTGYEFCRPTNIKSLYYILQSLTLCCGLCNDRPHPAWDQACKYAEENLPQRQTLVCVLPLYKV